MKITALDHVLFFADRGPSAAAKECVLLGQACELLGYDRFWISENHGSRSGCGSPEVLIAATGAVTERIRIGSAAVLASHYSALKIATTFNLLSRLYEGRIDAGLGRGTGGPPYLAKLMNPLTDESYPEKVRDFMRFLSRSDGAELLPAAPMPEIWIMGSSESGALLAADLGVNLCFAQFLHDDLRPDLLELYRARFQGGTSGNPPHASVCLLAACADSREDAAALEGLIALAFAGGRAADGNAMERAPHLIKRGLPSWGELAELRMPRLNKRGYRALVGDPEFVAERMVKIIDAYKPDEMAVATVSPVYDLRVRSYELIRDIMAGLR